MGIWRLLPGRWRPSRVRTDGGSDRIETETTAWTLADETCPHPADAVEFLGTNGLTRFYRCRRCDGVVITAVD